MSLKLCFGLRIDAKTWAEGLGSVFGKPLEKQCSFCEKGNPNNNNYCGNCGNPLARGHSVDASDVIDMTVRKLGKPPVPLELSCSDKEIYFCQVLGKSSGSYVEYRRDIDKGSWDAISKEIARYANVGTAMRPYLFAIGDNKEDKK